MTDHELLEKAAIAADMDYDPESAWPWNPLEDDGQALRLAVKLKIHIEWSFHGIQTPPQVQASPKGMGHLSDVQILGTDPYAATRRAIVRAAAAIGETL